MPFFSRFKHFNVPLTICLSLLILAGLSILYGTTLSEESKSIFYHQIIFFAAGGIGFVFFSFFDYHTLSKTNRIIYLIFALLLLYLVTFGSAIRGSRRWVDLGLFNFQPGEFIKVSVILGLSRLFYLKRGQINSWKTIIWSLVYAALPALLIVKQPDLGSSIIIMSLWGGLIMLSPIKKKFLAVLLIGFIIFAGGAWKFLLHDFQKTRVMVFLNPQLDPRGTAYNVKQAAIAVGAGKLFGRGLGKGAQSQHKFLPERQTDFIFAAASEEVGFMGSLSLLGLYIFLLTRIIKIARQARDDLGMYIAGGAFFFFFFHVLINIGMNMGLLPVTGIPLPFVSAGGSSVVVSLIILGIVQNISRQSKILRF